MPRAQFNLEDLKPFGRAIVEFLYDQRPNWTVSKLAEEVDISTQGLLDWIRNGVKPSPEKLQQLFTVMKAHGYMIEGHEVTFEILAQLAEISAPSSNPWRTLERYINRELRIPEEARGELLNTLRETENKYGSQSA